MMNGPIPNELPFLLPILRLLQVSAPLDFKPVAPPEIHLDAVLSRGESFWPFQEYLDPRVVSRGDGDTGSLDNIDRIVSRMSVTEFSRGHVRRRRVLLDERRRGRRLGSVSERVRHLDRCVHPESAAECVSGPNLRHL